MPSPIARALATAATIGAFVLVILLRDASAEEQTASADRASALKSEGDRRMREMHYEDALAAYNESYKLRPNPSVLYNRGRALQALGKYPEALDALEEFARIAPDDLRARVPDLAGLLEEVGDGISTLIVHSNVAGAEVRVRDKVEGRTPLPALRLRLGGATVVVRAEGYSPFEREVRLLSRGVTIVEVKLERGEKARRLPERETNAWKPVAYATGAVSIATLTAGALFGGLAMARKADVDTHCPAHVCDPTGSSALAEGRTFANVSTATIVTGAVALAACAVFFWLGSRESPSRPTASVTSSWVSFEGVF